MSESNVFMVWFFNGSDIHCSGVYSEVIDAEERLEEIAGKYDLDNESIWIEEYTMDKDIDL